MSIENPEKPEQLETIKSPEDSIKKEGEYLAENLKTLESLDPGDNISPEAVEKAGKVWEFLEKHPDFTSFLMGTGSGAFAGTVKMLGQENSDYYTILWNAGAGAAVIGGLKVLEKITKKSYLGYFAKEAKNK